MPSCRAARCAPWPARISFLSSTTIGFVQPNSRIRATIFETCSGGWFFAFAGYGFTLAIAQYSTFSGSSFFMGFR